MPDVQNVFRRGAAYWWRRTLHWARAGGSPITLAFSLGTKDLGVARRRAAAMTVQSEVVRMSLYERVAREGLSPDQHGAVLRSEMRAYRDGLEHLTAAWQANSEWARVTATDADLQIYEAIWNAFAETGVVDGKPSMAYADAHFDALTDEQRGGARNLLGSLDIRRSLTSETAQRLQALGIEPNPTNMTLATRLVLEARAQATRELRAGVETVATAAVGLAPVQAVAPVTPIVAVSAVTGVDATSVPESWRTVTPVAAAELMIAANPAMLEHRKDGKRAGTQVGEQTLRQIRWAAQLLQKSMNPDGPEKGLRPIWTCTFEDIVALDSWFDKLPVTCGKSPVDRDPSTSLQAICDRAVDRIDAGELEANAIGLDGVTTNKHLRKLKQVWDFVREQVSGLPEIKFARFMVPDLKDERDARDAYTVEQATEIFRLSPWTGCQGLADRLSAGVQLIHDSLFYVLLLVWYTGMRREEVCKLLVSDIGHEHGCWFISIRVTEAGRVKNFSSVRIMAIADELIRLGLLEYLGAMKAAGHSALFPELVAERESTKKGDVFYRIWWVYIAPLLTSLKRGQALHAARHSFDTELKELGVFPEHRQDALGHVGERGETRRYSKATRLRKLRALANKVPIVTNHLPDVGEINLLPEGDRKPRPARQRLAKADSA